MSELRGELERYLGTVFGGGASPLLVEVRWRRAGGMGRCFVPIARLDAAADAVACRSGATDVFVGVLPRWRRGGGRSSVADHARVVWVDIDSGGASSSLDAFAPAPSMVVASGGSGHLHAYWRLASPADPALVERVNRRLAVALGGDGRCADRARILRPAGTVNHGRDRAPVRLVALSGEPVALSRLEAALSGVAAATPPRCSGPRSVTVTSGDRLLGVEPERYVRLLTGQAVGRGRKVHCPLHEDRTPSLHVYENPADGWYCFGCGRGGSVYDLAAAVWGIEARGGGFAVLRRASAPARPRLSSSPGSARLRRARGPVRSCRGSGLFSVGERGARCPCPDGCIPRAGAEGSWRLVVVWALVAGLGVGRGLGDALLGGVTAPRSPRRIR